MTPYARGRPTRERPQDKSSAGRPDTHKNTPRQDSLDDALAHRDAGTQAALDGAHPWARIAGEQAIRDLAAAGGVLTAEDVRERVGAPIGCSPAVMGALFNAACRRGEIVMVSYRQSTRAERRGGLLRVWRGA